LDPIVSQELEHLDKIRVYLEQNPYVGTASERSLVEELVRLREEIRCARGEDRGAIMEQYNRYHAQLEQMRGARTEDDVDPASPYFGHLKVREGDRSWDLFIGNATRLAPGIRVVDWRNAPISRLYYQYQQGDEYDEYFNGKDHEGEILLRRAVRIRRGKLERIDAPEGRFLLEDDGWHREEAQELALAGAAQESARLAAGADRGFQLARRPDGKRIRADKRLPDIAGLLDEDQFEVITREDKGFLVIRGTAGSGKTTVLLHRIAWLGYQDSTINSPRTLVLMMSRALRDYTRHVLPALGVPKARVMTFRDWAHGQRTQHFPKLKRASRADTPAVVVRAKQHPALLHALESYIERSVGEPTPEQAFDDLYSLLSQVDMLEKVLIPAGFEPHEIRRIASWCYDRSLDVAAFLDDDPDADGRIDAEDDALLLRAYQLRVGPLRFRGKRKLTHRHIALDEVQDFAAVEVRVLIDTLDKRNSLTLAGDTQQHIMGATGFTSWSSFLADLGVDGRAVETLRIAYRSSKPIVSFARAVLGDLAEDDAPLVVRNGPPVEVLDFTDHGAAVEQLARTLIALQLEEPLANVALITPDTDVAMLYADGLDKAGVPRVHRVTDEDFRFEPGVEIVEARQVKGLEFDYVVIVEASAFAYPDTPTARRLLHVAATRAIHQLWVFSIRTLSPIIRDAIATTP